MIKNWIKTSIVLFVIWVILSGRLEPKFLIAGIVSSLIIAFFSQPLLWITDEDGQTKRFLLTTNIWRLLKFWIWLFSEIIKSSLSVSKAIVRVKMPIEPHLIRFKCTYRNPVATVLLINSIILTPSTLTVDVQEDGTFVVHALTNKAAEGLLTGDLQKRIGIVFGEEAEVEL